MSKNKKLFDDLKEFFIKVNKVRTDVMRAENPYDSYDYFAKDENPELIIRRGMTQYEDLVKKFKRMEKQGRKLSKDVEKVENKISIKSNIKKELKDNKDISKKKILKKIRKLKYKKMKK